MDSSRLCHNQKLNDSIYDQESKVQFVVDAVYSFAHALDKAWNDLCQSDEGYCENLKGLDGVAFYKKYLLNVFFTGKYLKIFLTKFNSLFGFRSCQFNNEIR